MSYDEHLISMAGGDGDTIDRGDNSDQPPEVDVHDNSKQLPPAAGAAERIRDFVCEFGDGDIAYDFPLGVPLYARDLEAVTRAVLAQQATLAAVLNLANTSGRCGWRISADELRRTLRGES